MMRATAVVALLLQALPGAHGAANATNATFVRGPEGLNYPEAEAFCTEIGATIASIHSAAQNDAVWNLNPSGIILIGFSDFNEEGTWVWDDASNASYTNWAKGRPETNGAQGRAFFYQGPKWHDCDDRTRCYAAAYICKISEPAGPGPPSGSHRRAPSTAGTIRPTSDFSPAWVAPASLRATSARKSSSDDGFAGCEGSSAGVLGFFRPNSSSMPARKSGSSTGSSATGSSIGASTAGAAGWVLGAGAAGLAPARSWASSNLRCSLARRASGTST